MKCLFVCRLLLLVEGECFTTPIKGEDDLGEGENANYYCREQTLLFKVELTSTKLV